MLSKIWNCKETAGEPSRLIRQFWIIWDKLIFSTTKNLLFPSLARPIPQCASYCCQKQAGPSNHRCCGQVLLWNKINFGFLANSFVSVWFCSFFCFVEQNIYQNPTKKGLISENFPLVSYADIIYTINAKNEWKSFAYSSSRKNRKLM